LDESGLARGYQLVALLGVAGIRLLPVAVAPVVARLLRVQLGLGRALALDDEQAS